MSQGAEAHPTVTVKEAKHMKIPLFYGRADGKDEISAEDLIDRIEALVRATGKGDDVAIQELYLALREDAVNWYKSLPMQGVDIKKWSDVKKQFLADYHFKIPGSVAYKLEALKQRSNERVIDFFSRVNEEIEHFMEGVPNKDARKTLLSARSAAQTMEYVETAKRRTTTNPVMAMQETEMEIDQIGQDATEDDEFDEDEISLINRYRNRVGKRPFRGRGGRGGTRFTGKCYNCDRPGHRSADCRQPKRNGVRSVAEEGDQRDDRENQLSMIAPLKNW